MGNEGQLDQGIIEDMDHCHGMHRKRMEATLKKKKNRYRASEGEGVYRRSMALSGLRIYL